MADLRYSIGVLSMDAVSLTSWLALQTIDSVGDRTLLKLIQTFGSPNAVQAASQDDLIRAGCSPEMAASGWRGPELKILQQIDR